MAGEAGQPSSIEIERLYDFLENLREGGYDIDTRQYIALNDLLLVLITRGKAFDEGLKTLVAPVICSTPEEQRDFYYRFDQWFETWLPKKLESTGRGATPSAPPAPRRWSFPTLSPKMIAQASLAVLSLIAAALVIIQFMSVLESLLPSLDLLTGLAYILLAGVAIRGLWIWYQDRRFIARGTADEEPVHQKIPVKRYLESVVPSVHFKPALKALRRRVQAPSAEVDVNRTIETALNRNKWVEFIYRQRQVLPEYVVFVERKSQQDHQARFVQEVLQRLAADGVWLHLYEFSDDPRLCFPLGRKDSPLRLQDLLMRYHNARALVFSGTGELIDPIDGNLREWIDQLAFWRDRAILTPDPISPELSDALKKRGIAISPLGLDSLASLVTVFESQRYPAYWRAQRPLPEPLVDRPTRWLGKIPPPEEEIDKLLTDLKYEYLDEAGFYWLCALAVYPELRWEITIYLGKNLIDERGGALLEQNRLLRLARLPWLRHSYLPDWLRLRLINRLDAQQNKSTRAVLADLFDPDKGAGDFALEIARATPKSRLERLKKLVRARFRKARADSPERDYIFVKFLTGSENQKLGLTLPGQLRQAFAPPPLRVSGAVVGVLSVGFALLQRLVPHQGSSSDWQQRLLDAVAELGEEGLQAAQYLRLRKARIGFNQMRPNNGATWTLSGDIVLNTRYYNYDTPLDDLRLRTLIIHEARSLQQGISIALSVYGVLDAWQTEFRVYQRVKGRYPHTAVEYLMDLPLVYDREILKRAVTLMQDYAGKGYRADLLPLFPIEKEIRYQLFRTIPKPYSTDGERDAGDPTLPTGRDPNIVRAAYSNEMAWQLARMSQLAYHRFEDDGRQRELIMANLKGMGFELLNTFRSETTDTQAFLASNKEYLVLAFRGTEIAQRRDIKADVGPIRISAVEGKIHSGFRTAYDSLAPDITKSLLRRSSLPIYVTGHSLGAALAVVATQELEHTPEIRDRIAACYTFGSPRVGESHFDLEFRSPIYRIVNTADVVTVLPLLALGYVHLGEVHFLGRKDGEIRRGIPFLQRLVLFAAPWFRPEIRDHEIAEYVRKLERIASPGISRIRTRNLRREKK